jgi:hypothetical protein
MMPRPAKTKPKPKSSSPDLTVIHLGLSPKAARALRSELQAALDEEEYVVANRTIIEGIVAHLTEQL